MRLSDRGFTSTRGLSYTLADTAANVDAALPITHGLGALPSSLELWVEVSAGQWEQQDPATYVTASTTALTGTGTTLASVVGGSTNVRLVAAAGAVALSVAEASASQPGIVSTGAQTIAGAKTFSGEISTDAAHRGGYGLLPVGAIVAYNPGYYTNGSNGGFTISGPGGNSVAQVNSFLNGKGWYVCDGAALNNAASPIWNAAGRHLPNLGDSRFLMGSTAAGASGGASSVTLSSANIPTLSVSGSTGTGTTGSNGSHTHTMAHTHSISHDHASFTTASGGAHQHSTNTYDYAYEGISSRADVATGRSSASTSTQNISSTNSNHTHSIDVPSISATSGAASNSTTTSNGSHDHSIPSLSVSASYTNASPTSFSVLPTYLSTFFIVRAF